MMDPRRKMDRKFQDREDRINGQDRFPTIIGLIMVATVLFIYAFLPA